MNDTFKNTGTPIPAAQSPAVQDTAEPVPVTRIFKARLFEMIFSDRKELLGLYNAVSKTNYTGFPCMNTSLPITRIFHSGI